MTILSMRALRASLLAWSCAWATTSAATCDGLWQWAQYQCEGLRQAWDEGSPDVYLTGYAHHNRHTYSADKLAQFNERAWGGGLGRSRTNDRGDTFGWYALAFRDSHYAWTKMVGWTWRTYWPADSDYALGLGYTAFLGSRPDIFDGIPFPGVLPLASVKLHRFEVLGTYIPKVSSHTTGNGNVGFLFMRVRF